MDKDMSEASLIETIHSPADLRQLSRAQLKQLAREFVVLQLLLDAS